MAKPEIDAQQELNDAFEAVNFTRFKNAIKLGADPNYRSQQDDDNQLTIYEKALSKSKEACRFITICLNKGCDANYVNPKLNKAAINFAADSKNFNNLRSLLNRRNCKVNVDHLYEQETALSKLVKDLRQQNAVRLTKCIRLLLMRGASPNFVDLEGKTPMQQVLVNGKISQETRTTLIIEFLKLPELNEPNYLQGLEFLLQQPLDGHKSLIYKLLVRQLLSQYARQMFCTLAQHKKNIKGWEQKKMLRTLLMEHIAKQTKNALGAVIKTLEINTLEENEYLLELAIEEGSWSTLLSLLKSDFLKNLSRVKLLKTIIKQLQVRPLINYVESNEYEECLLQLLKDQQHCLNEYDEHRNTLLHYAVSYRNEIAIRVLLREGARLGMRNEKNRLVIEDMDAKQLEEHLDYCITTRGGKSSHEDYEIIMNYLNLTNDRNELDIAPIACMAQSKELCQLLEHPLITCFLQLKWRRLAKIFFSHLVTFIILSSVLLTHVLLRFPNRLDNELPIWIVAIILKALIGYVLLAELLAFALANHRPSLVDVPLISILILTCIEWGEQIETQRMVAVFAIMLMGIKLMQLIGALPVPAISTDMLMLRQVASNFARSLLQYSLLLYTFSVCFYVLFARPKDPETTDSSNTDFNLSFTSPDLSIMKTLLMFSGEYNDNDFNGYFSSFLIIMFMFVAMVLTNLLSGLAVNDTQMIRAQVELNAAICRTNLLFQYEGTFNKRWSRVQKLMKIRPESIYGYVSIFPNQDNRAEVYSSRHRNQSIEQLANEDDDVFSGPDFADEDSENSSEPEEDDRLGLKYNEDVDAFELTRSNNGSLFKRNSNFITTIDNETVTRALKIIKETEMNNIKEQREKDSEQRLEEIRTLLKEVKNELNSKKPPN